MRKAILVHCWDGTPNYCWYPEVKKDLENAGFEVIIPEMPQTSLPKKGLWVSQLSETIGQPNEEHYLIGHSIGCSAIMRYLETLPDGVKVGGVVLVAGFTDPLGFVELENWFAELLDYQKIKEGVISGNITLIHSDNDPFVPLRYGENLSKKLSAKLLVINGAGHFSGPIDDEASYTSLPEITQIIQEYEVQSQKS